MGPFSESWTFEAGAKTLYLTADMKALLRPRQQQAFTVDLLDGPGGAVLARDVPVFSGSITANLTHRVTRSGTFTVGPQFWPDENADGVLTPVSTVARVRAGIEDHLTPSRAQPRDPDALAGQYRNESETDTTKEPRP